MKLSSITSEFAGLLTKPYVRLLSMNEVTPEIAELERQLEKVSEINDVAERVLAAEGLKGKARAMRSERANGGQEVYSMLGFVAAGLVMGALATPFIAVPLLTAAVIGAASGYAASAIPGTAAMFVFLAKDKSLALAAAMNSRAAEIIKNAPRSANFIEIARSPHFDALMQKYPDLQESFVLASARLNATQSLTKAPNAAVAPGRKNPTLKL